MLVVLHGPFALGVLVVDYTRSTGSAGTMIIRDDGEWVLFRLQCDDSATNVGSASWSGTVNGASVGGSFSWPSGGGARNIGGPWRVSSSQTVTFRIGGTGTSGLGGPTSFSHAISRAKPNAPTSLIVSRVSDSQQTLNWNRTSTYTSVVVQRRTSSGGSWGSWQQVGVASGNAFTFTDTSTVAGRRYEYRVAGRAASGQSSWSGTEDIYTTPLVPTGVSAVRSGLSIVVDASNRQYAATWDVRDGSTTVATGVSLPWTHVSPEPSEPHTYQVRSKRGSLVSAWSQSSNTVQLLTPPNAPTGLAPNGRVVSVDAAYALTWVHNPVDSSPQTAFELRVRAPGGAWTVIPGGSESSYPVGVGGLGGDIEWEVRTKGEHPDWSPWSATAAFTVIDPPGVAIISPEDTWDASILPVEWSWFQDQSRPQSAWEAVLLNEFGDTVETRSGSGAATSVTFAHRLTQGGWTVQVRAATGEVWSVWAEQSFTVVFEPPAPPRLEGSWDEAQGGVVLVVGRGVPGVGVFDDGAWFAEFEG